MELWIRSQDRKKLIKVDEIKIETVVEGNTFICPHCQCCNDVIFRRRYREKGANND